MDNITFEALHKYYSFLSVTGYKNYSGVYKLLVLAILKDLIYNDFRGCLNKEDYHTISKFLYSLFGTDCLLPYPKFCNDYNMKNRRLFTGTLAELTCRLKDAEKKTVENTQQIQELSEKSISQENTINNLVEVGDMIISDLNSVNRKVATVTNEAIPLIGEQITELQEKSLTKESKEIQGLQDSVELNRNLIIDNKIQSDKRMDTIESKISSAINIEPLVQKVEEIESEVLKNCEDLEQVSKTVLDILEQPIVKVEE